MSKTVWIRFSPNHSPKDFSVGEFVSIGFPHITPKGVVAPKPSLHEFLEWVNDLATKGLVYHSQFGEDYLFRVDGAVIEQLKKELSLDSSTLNNYTGGDPLYESYTKLQLYLDGEPISSVDLS